MPSPDRKSIAMTGAFFARFALGFFVATIRLPLPAVATGLVVGLLTSLPDAIITGTFVPIVVVGLVLGAIGGWIVGRRWRD